MLTNKNDVKLINSWPDFASVKKRDLKFEEAVGERVKTLRTKLGWSQKHLADLADLEQNQIGRVESGKNSASLRILVAISKALGLQPFELLRVEFEVKVNEPVEKIEKKEVKTTLYIKDLVKTSFFNTPKSVADVLSHFSDINLTSPATSAVLKKFVARKVLKKTPGKIKGRFLYQKAT